MSTSTTVTKGARFLATYPLVSVIICTYNQERFIGETIESVLAQTYAQFEVIVTDDCSTDSTPAIIKRYESEHPNQVKAVLSPRNTGIPGNFNRALAVRTGELVSILDGDDLMLPTKLEKQVVLMTACARAGGCFHDADVFESETGRSIGLFSQLYNGTTKLAEGAIDQWFLPRNFFLQSSLMYRSALCPPWGYDERLPLFSEAMFCAETLINSELAAIKEPLVRYRRHANNLTQSEKMRQTSLEHELVAYAILDARYPQLHRVTRRLRLSALMTNALKLYREENGAAFRQRLGALMNQGAVTQAVALRFGARFMSKQISAFTGTTTFQRPSWVKRLSRWLLKV